MVDSPHGKGVTFTIRSAPVEYAAEYFTSERCDGLSIIGLLCIIPFSMGEEVGVQSWSWRVRGQESGVRSQGSVVRS